MSSLLSNLEVQIRKEVEQLLRKHVRRLSGVTHELSNVFLSLDLLTLTSTVLLVERESEISQGLEDERYNENALLKSLSELGLSQEREVKRSLQLMEQKKYYDHTEDNKLRPLEVANKLNTHINEIFPKMPGLNLIVYFNQIMDEVLSSRKTVELAVAQIDKTLQTQGVSKFKTKGKAKPKRKETKARPSLASLLNKSKRLSSLGRRKKEKPLPQPKVENITPEPDQPKPPVSKETLEEKAAKIVSDDLGNYVDQDFEGAYAINPDEIGAGVTDPQALADQFLGADGQTETPNVISSPDTTDSEDNADTEESESKDEIGSNAQSYADDLFDSFQSAHQPASDDASANEDKDKPEDIEDDDDHLEDEDEDEEHEDIDEEDEEETDEDEDEDEEEEEEDDDDDDTDEDDEIKSQIEAMNESLKTKRGLREKGHEPINCPLCHEETIVEMETSSHKTYYTCNNDECKFISWEKPYDQKCPKCEEPFLIQTHVDDVPVYQCPNDNCDFEVNLDDVDDDTFLPQTESITEPEISKPKKKKKRKKLVRKVKVKRK